MRPVKDPAPSRLAYKLNRLLLRPMVRRFLRYGLPVLILIAGVAFWASDQARRDDAMDRLAEIPSVVGLKWATPRSDSMEFETVCARFSERFVAAFLPE